MFAAMGKALVIFAPIGIVATVLLNVLDASRPVALAIVLTISGTASVVGALFYDPPQQDRKSSRPRSRGPADA